MFDDSILTHFLIEHSPLSEFPDLKWKPVIKISVRPGAGLV